jgi:hypothetical protein
MQTHAASSPFQGTWDVTHATLPDGTFAYTGRINIQQNAANFHLAWEISAGRYVGIGLLHGDHLLVSCGEQFAGLGVALYTTHAETPPTIQWSTAELAGAMGAGMFTNTWFGTFEGEHQLIQSLPYGAVYGEWTVAIHKVDAIYQLTWRKGDQIHFHGIGLETAHGLAVGWYPDIAQLAFLDYHPDPQLPHQLHAIWALGNATTVGTETLTRL